MPWAETVEVVAVSAKAVLVRYEDVEDWVPFSQVLDDSEIYSGCQIGDTGTLVIPEWLAQEKGFML
jgi:hypothetical protein